MGQAKNWTQEEYEYLEEHWGNVSVSAIAQKLNRSVNAIKIKAFKRHLGPVLESGDYVTLNQLIIAVTGSNNSYSYKMISWVKNRGLPVHTKKVVDSSFKVVYIDEFWEWAEKTEAL